MIRLLEDYSGEGLRDSHYSATILSHLNAYGTKFDFCRFYEIFYREPRGIICVFNGTVAVELFEGYKPTNTVKREIAEFVDFQSPNVVELPGELVMKRGFSGYEAAKRTFFEIPFGDTVQGLTEPSAEQVYKTVEAPAEGYPLWLTDVMRRRNRSQLWFLGYESSVLCVRFCLSGRAYITDLATPEPERGKGHARELLQKTARLFAEKNAATYAAAMPELYEFYARLGCSEIGEDKVFMRKQEK